MKIELGKWNHLVINRFTEQGAYLDGGEVGEILMPKSYVPRESIVGDEVEVFVYFDQSERLVATLEEPKAEVGDFAFLQVAWVNEYGAFLDWGLMKDLFVPFHEQKMRMQKDRGYIVYVHIDPETYRIVGSAKVEHYLSEDFPPYQPGDQVNILIWQKTDLGFKAIVDNRFGGLLYDNQVFKSIRTGDRLTAYIEQVRPDGKIDLTLQRTGKGRLEDFSDVLIKELTDAGGFLPFSDSSSAEDIVDRFGVSKKTFKRTVGNLYKQQRIKLGDGGIYLIH